MGDAGWSGRVFELEAMFNRMGQLMSAMERLLEAQGVSVPKAAAAQPKKTRRAGKARARK